MVASGDLGPMLFDVIPPTLHDHLGSPQSVKIDYQQLEDGERLFTVSVQWSGRVPATRKRQGHDEKRLAPAAKVDYKDKEEVREDEVARKEPDENKNDATVPGGSVKSDGRKEPDETSGATDIAVKTLYGNKTINVGFEASDTVKTLKEKLQATDPGMSLGHQRLYFAGEQLEDGRTLSSYNVQRDSTLLLAWGSPGSRLERLESYELDKIMKSGQQEAEPLKTVVLLTVDDKDKENEREEGEATKELDERKQPDEKKNDAKVPGGSVKSDGRNEPNEGTAPIGGEKSDGSGELDERKESDEWMAPVVSEEPDEPREKLLVKTIYRNEVICVAFESRDTVKTLKDKLQAKDPRVSSARQRLFFDGEHLEDDRTLSSYFIQRNSTLLVAYGQPDTLTQLMEDDELEKMVKSGQLKLAHKDTGERTAEGEATKELDERKETLEEGTAPAGGQTSDEGMAPVGSEESDKGKEEPGEGTAPVESEESDEGKEEPGDGTVPVESEMPDEFKGAAREEGVVVKSLYGNETVYVEFEASDTVKTFKEKLQATDSRMLVNLQRLFFAGEQLEDDRTLSSYNVQRDSTLLLAWGKPHSMMELMENNELEKMTENGQLKVNHKDKGENKAEEEATKELDERKQPDGSEKSEEVTAPVGGQKSDEGMAPVGSEEPEERKEPAEGTVPVESKEANRKEETDEGEKSDGKKETDEEVAPASGEDSHKRTEPAESEKSDEGVPPLGSVEPGGIEGPEGRKESPEGTGPVEIEEPDEGVALPGSEESDERKEPDQSKEPNGSEKSDESKEADEPKVAEEIAVKALCDGKMIYVEFEATDTVNMLKKKLKAKDPSISLGYLRLYFACEQLEDDRTLSSYNVQRDSTLLLAYGSPGSWSARMETISLDEIMKKGQQEAELLKAMLSLTVDDKDKEERTAEGEATKELDERKEPAESEESGEGMELGGSEEPDGSEQSDGRKEPAGDEKSDGEQGTEPPTCDEEGKRAIPETDA